MRIIACLAAVACTISLSTGFARSPGTETVAAPRIIMFYGGDLGGQRVYMLDMYENLRFMLSVSAEGQRVPDVELNGAFVEVSMYWHNPTWERFAADTGLLRTLKPEQGQRFRLHLPQNGSSAYLERRFQPKFNKIDSTGIGILKKYGVSSALE